jgi:hypothetical protein
LRVGKIILTETDRSERYSLRTPSAKEIAMTTAMLNDIQREFIGADAIRGFGDKEIFGDNVTMALHRAWDRHGDVTVHAKLDGTYDKTGLPDPLILSFYFSLRGDQITQLIIVHNKTEV